MLNLQKFIKDNPFNWESKLEGSPYNLHISRKDGYVLLKYNQIESDFSNPIVQESRGIILDEENGYKVVSKAFNKFFNYGESLSAKIDWKTAKIQEKVDGSILKIAFFDRLDKWVVSTNGTIYAENASVAFPKDGITNFKEMFDKAYSKNILYGDLDKDYTHCFELVGPQNRVVVPYLEIELFYLTSVNNKTFVEKEDPALKGFAVPLSYYFNSLEETIEFSKSENFNIFRNEGFVVKDGNYNRIKIKTEDYLRLHRLRGSSNPTPKRFLELMRINESEEFLSYFPEYIKEYESFKEKYNSYKTKLDELLKYFFTIKTLERKEFAFKSKETFSPTFLFGLLDNRWNTSNEYMEKMKEKFLIEELYRD